MFYNKIISIALFAIIALVFNTKVFGNSSVTNTINYKRTINMIGENIKHNSITIKNVENTENLTYQDVCASLIVEATFDGIKLSWENPEEEEVIIEIYFENDNEELILIDVTNTNSLIGSHLVVDQEPIETSYVIVVKDTLGNRCNDIKTTLIPFSRILIDRNNYESVYQIHDTPADFGWVLSNTFDGIVGNQGYHSPSEWTDPNGKLPEYANWSYEGEDINVSIITWDIGDEVQLSRFKYWPRQNNHWDYYNPHLFDLWGTNQLNADGTLDGWTLLLENVGPVKPSGTLTNEETTAEDIAAAQVGFIFDIPIEMPKVRYVRFVQKVAQNRINASLHLSEVEFYGTSIEERPSYKDLCESLNVEATFGGIEFSWENPEEKEIIIEVYTKNNYGQLIFVDAINTNSETGSHLVLNQEAVETTYTFVINDTLDSSYRCNDVKITPIPTTFLDRNNYQAVYQKHDTPSGFGWILPNTYDDVVSGDNGYLSTEDWIDPNGELPEYANWSYEGADLNVSIITWDIGDLVQLYRFKYWPRINGYEWRDYNPLLFDLWGTNELNEDGSLDGWTLLLENVGPVKPSGTLTNEENTAEDIAAAEAGFHFNIPAEMPTVRYIRFVQKVAQNKTNANLNLSEVEFYGTISDEGLTYNICESLKSEVTFAGVELSWENPEEKEIIIEVYIENDNEELISVDVINTNSAIASHLLVDQEPVETNYVFVVQDTFGNRCDDIKAVLTPISTTLLDRNNYQAVYQIHDTPSDFGWFLSRTYDGVIGSQGYHSPISWIDPNGALPEYANWSYEGVDRNVTIITWDIGDLVQLSIFKYWPRLGNWHWRHLNPHLFDLWGTDQLNEDGSLDGWTLLLENAGPVKPSGTLTYAENTAEDIAAAEAGHYFNIPTEMPKVRYIRFVQKVAQYRPSSALHLSEVEFYGAVSEGSLSNNDFEVNNERKLYPNPTSLGYINISNGINSKIDVTVLDILGNKVIEQTMTTNKLDVSTLKPGVYIVKIAEENKLITKKLVIKK